MTDYRSTTDPLLRITLLEEGQEISETHVRDIVLRCGMVFGGLVKDLDINTPPGSPVEFDAHYIGTSPTGAWEAYQEHFVMYIDGAWEYSGDLIHGGSFYALTQGVLLDSVPNSGVAQATSNVFQINSASGGDTDYAPKFQQGVANKIEIEGDGEIANASPPNPRGMWNTMILEVQTGGPHVPTWGNEYRWPGATVPALSSGTAKDDIFVWMNADGVHWLVTYSEDSRQSGT